MDLLVGARGYIGSHLADRLKSLSIQYIPIASRTQFYDIVNSLQGESIETVYWCASAFMPNQVSAVATDGIDEFEYLCDSMNRNLSFQTLILLSSLGQAKDDFLRLPEHLKDPVAMYFDNRFRLEEKFFQFDCPGAILRLANVYGPRVAHQYGVIASWIRSVQNAQPITVTEVLENSRDYIYIGDVIDAIIAARSSQGKDILDIGTGSKTSLSQLITIISEIIAVDIQYLSLVDSTFQRTIPDADLIKTFAKIQWSPSTTLKDGLRFTLGKEGLL